VLKRIPPSLLVGVYIGVAIKGNSMKFLKKLNLGIYPNEMKLVPHKDTSTLIFIAVLHTNPSYRNDSCFFLTSSTWCLQFT
jgi:hypothetical protein